MNIIEEITAERKRQVEQEGWSPRHDDLEHPFGELAKAAACYAWPDAVIMDYPDRVQRGDERRLVWPWDRHWWKPRSTRRNLIRAAALIVAEIERLDRAAAKPEQDTAAEWPDHSDKPEE